MATIRLWFDPGNKALHLKSGVMRYPHLEVHSAALGRTISLPVDEQYGHPFHQLNLVDAKRLPAEVRDHLTEVTLEEVVAGPLADLLAQGRWKFGPMRIEVKGEPASSGWAVRIFIKGPSITHVSEWLKGTLAHKLTVLPEELYYQPPAPAPAAQEAATPQPAIS